MEYNKYQWNYAEIISWHLCYNNDFLEIFWETRRLARQMMVEAMVFIPGESCLNFFLPSGTDCSIISAANGDFSIGEAARRIHMATKALRHYDRIGPVRPGSRPANLPAPFSRQLTAGQMEISAAEFFPGHERHAERQRQHKRKARVLCEHGLSRHMRKGAPPVLWLYRPGL